MQMYESSIRSLTRTTDGPKDGAASGELVADLLIRAAYLSSQPEAWCQHYLARFRDGTGTYSRKRLRSIKVESRCMLGALYSEYDRDPLVDIHAAYEAIVQSIGTSRVADWNDAPSRTQNEVVAALLRAASIAEAL